MKPELASLLSVAMTTAAVSSSSVSRRKKKKDRKDLEDLWPEAPPTGGIHRSNLATQQPGNKKKSLIIINLFRLNEAVTN